MKPVFCLQSQLFFPRFRFLWKKSLNNLPKPLVVCNIFLVKIGKVFFSFLLLIEMYTRLFVSCKKIYLLRWDFLRISSLICHWHYRFRQNIVHEWFIIYTEIYFLAKSMLITHFCAYFIKTIGIILIEIPNFLFQEVLYLMSSYSLHFDS